MKRGKGQWPCTMLLVWVSAFACKAGDWPQFRGPAYNGVSTDRIKTNWTGATTNPLWRVALTNGVSSVSVSGGRVLTKVKRGSGEYCLALSVTNGSELWATWVGNAVYDGGVGLDDGPRTTPTVEGDSVYVLSSYLGLYRLNITNGAIIWHQDLRATYGGTVIGWQNAASPRLEGGLIFVNGGGGTNRLLALRAIDGSLAWRAENEPMTHSTPTLATIHGVRQVIFAGQSNLVSLDPQTGALLWKFRYPFNYSISLAVSPVVHQDMILISASYNMGTLVIRANYTNDAWTATRLWYTNTFASHLASHWMTPVCHQGFVYGQFGNGAGSGGFDTANAQLKCIEMETGVVKWSTNGFGRGGILLVDNRLLIATERGDLVLAEPNTNAYTQISRFLAIPGYHDFSNKVWNCHGIADGRVYVRSTAHLACFDFSVPALTLDPPQFLSTDELTLTIRTANGAPLTSSRIANIALWTESDPAQPLVQWDRLTNEITLSNGVGQVRGIDSHGQPQRFFIATEPEAE